MRSRRRSVAPGALHVSARTDHGTCQSHPSAHDPADRRRHGNAAADPSVLRRPDTASGIEAPIGSRSRQASGRAGVGERSAGTAANNCKYCKSGSSALSGRTKTRRLRDAAAALVRRNAPRVVLCDYCGHVALLVTGPKLYPHRPDLYEKRMYRCDPCDAHVGCHPGTTIPLGRLANAELRKAKMDAHGAFDPLWHGGNRKAAYAWLSKALEIPANRCHIGMMDVDDCRRVVDACNGPLRLPDARAP